MSELRSVRVTGRAFALCGNRSRLSRRLISPALVLRMRLRGVREKRSSLRLVALCGVGASASSPYGRRRAARPTVGGWEHSLVLQPLQRSYYSSRLEQTSHTQSQQKTNDEYGSLHTAAHWLARLSALPSAAAKSCSGLARAAAPIPRRAD